MNERKRFFLGKALHLSILSLLLLLCSFQLFAQTTITGTIKTQKGDAIPGVTITLKGKAKSILSDKDGNFTLAGVLNTDTLLFTFTGYRSHQEITKGRTQLSIVLTEDVSALNEVLVVGYGTVNKRDLTGSVSSIKSDELMKSKSISFMEALQGKIPGVQVVSNSGEPGAGVTVNIRGGNSIDAGTQPLYVIDGMQIDINTNEVASSSYGADAKYNPLANINPSDIESIEVLKDASATAIYGSRAANGVVMITTKKGYAQQPSFNFNSYVGFSQQAKRMNMLAGADYLTYRYNRTPASLTWGVDTDNDGFANHIRPITDFKSYNWQDEVMHNGLIQNYNVGITGGKGNTNLAASFGYLNQSGIVEKNNFRRYSALVRGDATVNGKLTIGGNINLSHAISAGAVATAQGAESFTGLLQGILIYSPILRGAESEDDIEQNGGVSNPLTLINDAVKQIATTRAMINGTLKYKFTDALTLDIYAGGILTNSKGEEWYPATTSWGAAPKNGLAMINTANTYTLQNSNTLTYSKKIGKNHALNALLGFEVNQYNISSFGTRAIGFENQQFNPVYDINQGNILPDKVQSSRIENSRVSEFARLNYTLNNKYLFTATVRRDGSSKFGKNNKYAVFPSGAIAWKLHEETFMKSFTFLSELKLRGSYGLTGNDRIPEYRSLSRTDKAYYGNDQGGVDLGLSPSEIANPNLKWETTAQFDFGIDLGLFKDRITFVADWYKKITKDMLLQTNIASQIGSARQWQNIGQINNTGLEFGLNTKNVMNKNFSWTSSFNISTNINDVVSLGNSPFLIVSGKGGHISELGRVMVGNPLGRGWGYVFDGIYQTTDFNTDGTLKQGIPSYTGIVVKPGDMKFRDLNNDGTINPQGDKTFISDSNPKHFGGLTNAFQYKNFDLSVFLQWSYGNEVLNTGRYRYEGNNVNYNVTYDYYNNRWTPENPTNRFPATEGKFRDQNSTFYAEDASFLRLKNIVLGYNLPKSILDRLKMRNCYLYASAENLYTWTKYSGFDPEVSYHNKLITGFDDTAYPRAKTFTFGLNVRF